MYESKLLSFPDIKLFYNAFKLFIVQLSTKYQYLITKNSLNEKINHQMQNGNINTKHFIAYLKLSTAQLFTGQE